MAKPITGRAKSDLSVFGIYSPMARRGDTMLLESRDGNGHFFTVISGPLLGSVIKREDVEIEDELD